MYEHMADAIKQPTLVRLTRNLHVARFESMKVYSAMAAVKHLLEIGAVRPGDTLIDSSSGVYAYALAMACHRFGLKCHIVASALADRVVRVQLEILGATVEQVANSNDPRFDQKQRVERIAEILGSHEDVHWMRQYHDSVHYLGYHAIAESIADEIDLVNLTLVGGVGSGASTGGLTTHLRRIEPDVELVGVQPFGSVTFGSENVEDSERSMATIAGIGSSITFGNVRHELYDKVHWVGFGHAASGAVALLRRHGLFSGLSAGASFLAAHREARLRPDRNILFIAADTGHRYVDNVFAHHRDAAPFDQLEPVPVDSLKELTLPWSVMDWDRRSFPFETGVVTP